MLFVENILTFIFKLKEEEPILSELSFNKDRTSNKSKRRTSLIGRNKSAPIENLLNTKNSNFDDELSLRERASIIAKRFTQILRSKEDFNTNLYEDNGPFLEIDAEKDSKLPQKNQQLSVSRLSDEIKDDNI